MFLHLRLPSAMEQFSGEKGRVDSELWHACAGPLVSLPAVGTRVVYFPQGHSEQVSKLCLGQVAIWCQMKMVKPFISSGWLCCYYYYFWNDIS